MGSQAFRVLEEQQPRADSRPRRGRSIAQLREEEPGEEDDDGKDDETESSEQRRSDV